MPSATHVTPSSIKFHTHTHTHTCTHTHLVPCLLPQNLHLLIFLLMFSCGWIKLCMYVCVCAHVCKCRLRVHMTRLIRPHEPHEPAAGTHIKVGKTLNLHSPSKFHPTPPALMYVQSPSVYTHTHIRFCTLTCWREVEATLPATTAGGTARAGCEWACWIKFCMRVHAYECVYRLRMYIPESVTGMHMRLSNYKCSGIKSWSHSRRGATVHACVAYFKFCVSFSILQYISLHPQHTSPLFRSKCIHTHAHAHTHTWCLVVSTKICTSSSSSLLSSYD